MNQTTTAPTQWWMVFLPSLKSEWGSAFWKLNGKDRQQLFRCEIVRCSYELFFSLKAPLAEVKLTLLSVAFGGDHVLLKCCHNKLLRSKFVCCILFIVEHSIPCITIWYPQHWLRWFAWRSEEEERINLASLRTWILYGWPRWRNESRPCMIDPSPTF